MKRFIIFLTLNLIFSSLSAQSALKNTQWMQYLEELAESEETEENSIEHLFDELSYLSENPLDLNTVTKAELEKLPFLSDIQIENLLYYLYRYAPLSSLYELKNVEDLDMQTISYLLPFVYIGEVKEKIDLQPGKVIKYGKNDWILRSDYCLQKKAGFQETAEDGKEKSPSQYYLGEPYSLSFKYGFQYKDYLQFGISGEKDSGEAFWNKNHHGFDFYSLNLAIKNIRFLEGLYLGDYQLSFGQGLVLNTDFSMGKTSDATNISKKNSSIKRHFSFSENGFFRGIAGTLKINRTRLSLFYSHRQPDASADSSFIYTFKTDGYNRTLKDLEKRRQSTINVYGGHIQWEQEGVRLGITAAYYNFGDKELNPDQKPYNIFSLRGKKNYNAGFHYGFHNKKYSFQGETATDKNGGIATINNLHLSPASFINLTLSYRNYTKNYQTLFGKAFSESSTVQNETGFYTGVKLKFLRNYEFTAYLDHFQFPWLKYGINSPSSGTDGLLQLSCKPKQNFQVNLRYKYKKKQKNRTSEETTGPQIMPYTQQKWRCQASYQTTSGFQLKTQFDYNLYKSSNRQPGWSISQSWGYHPDHRPLQIDCAIAYFFTNDWNSRINVYEKNILYAFSFPSYYGEGLRYYTVIKWRIVPKAIFYIKAASTHYFDRSTISSGPEEIKGKEKTDIQCLLRFIF